MFPANEHEQAVEAALDTFRADSRELLDRTVLAEEPGPGDLARLGELSEAVASGVRSVLRRWRHLDLESPYRHAALEELDDRLAAIVREGSRKPSLVGEALGLEGELRRVLTTRAAAQMGDALREARGDRTLREVAERVGMSVGRLSELERGHRGIPVELTARRLDQELHAGVIRLRREASKRMVGLDEIVEGRRAQLGDAGVRIAPRVRARVQGVIDAISADEQLLDQVDAFVRLPKRVRNSLGRASIDLARELGVAP